MLFKKYGAKSNDIQLALHYSKNPSKVSPYLTEDGDYYRVVKTLNDRDSIPAAERSFGMRVVVILDPVLLNNGTYVLANVALGGTNNDVMNNVNFIPDNGGFVPTGAATDYIRGNGTYANFNNSVKAIAWGADGNSFGALKYIGTNDNFAFPIAVNGAEVARFDTGGNFGIGTPTPTAKTHIKDTVDGIATGNPNVIFETTTGGVLFESKSVDGFKIKFSEGVNDRGSFTNAGGYAQLVSQFRFTLKDYANVSKLWMDSANGYIGIGAAYFAADAQLHVQGQSSTNADYAFKMENSAGNTIITGRNDQKVYIKTPGGWAADVTLGVGGAVQMYGWRSRGIHRINYGNNDIQPGDSRPNIEWDNSVDGQVFITGIKNDDTWGIFCKGASDYGFEIDRVTRNIGISRATASDTKFYIRGASATSADYALKADNVANNPLLHVRNDGFASFNQLIDPTSILAVTAAAFINAITANADGGYALLGNANTGVGVRGTNLTSYGIGVDGFSTNNVGVRGQSTNGAGGQFIAPMAIIGTGKVKFDALPTSAAGLTAGELWNNGGVVNIV